MEFAENWKISIENQTIAKKLSDDENESEGEAANIKCLKQN